MLLEEENSPLDTRKTLGMVRFTRTDFKNAMIKAGLNPPKSLDLVQQLETNNAENMSGTSKAAGIEAGVDKTDGTKQKAEAKFSIRKNMTQKDYEQRLQVDSDKFAKIVDELEKNQQKWFDNHKNQLLDFMSRTPLVLTLVGAEQLPVKITAGFLGHATKGAHPGMSAKVLKQIPQAMAEPLMVLKNFENVNGKRIEFPNKKILVLKLKNDYGATIIVPLKLDVEEKRGFGKINLIQTAFGVGDKKPKYQYFVDALQNNEVLYIDDKRSLEWAKTAKDARTDTLAGLIRKRASDDIILHKQALVNKRNSFLNALYQAAWHGTPAIIEGNLTTKRIGEGEGAIAHGWGFYFAKSREVSQVNYRERLTQSQGLKPTGKVSITDSETGKKYSWDIEDIDAGYDIVHQEYLSAVTDQAIRYFLEARGNLSRAIDFAEDAVASKKAFLEEWENKKPSSDEEVRKYKEAKKQRRRLLLTLSATLFPQGSMVTLPILPRVRLPSLTKPIGAG